MGAIGLITTISATVCHQKAPGLGASAASLVFAWRQHTQSEIRTEFLRVCVLAWWNTPCHEEACRWYLLGRSREFPHAVTGDSNWMKDPHFSPACPDGELIR